MNDRNTLLKVEVLEKLNGISALNNATLTLLWDNLYYQTLTRESSYVRQACIQMLIANNFIQKHTSYDALKFKGTEDEYLERLANAKVVINKAFTVESEDAKEASYASLENITFLKKESEKYFVNQDIKVYQKSLEEINSTLRKTYNASYQEAYDKASDAYEKNITELITNEVKATQKELQEKENQNALAEKREPQEIPYDIEYPTFEFNFNNNLFSKEFTGVLSKETNDILKEVNVTTADTIDDVATLLDKKIMEESAYLFSLTETSKKEVSINGVPIRPIPYPFLKPYCFTVSVIRSRISLFTPITMYINLGANVLVTSETHTLTVSPSESYTSTNSLNISQAGATNYTLSLFPNESFNMSNKSFELEGEFVLSNGKKVIYKETVSVKGFTNGCSKVIDDTPSPDNPVEVQLYGIGKVGVADFRKVEQEVCCYVPGNVSHIENILAKEYKERATKSLSRIEQVNETTVEKEVENLKDTATTERNEMQTEVSSVLNEDQSTAYGATAGVSGEYMKVKFSANAYADFSNSSSSSQANLNAQTYAQEITERTLERIVQKTTKKQTSRILKEFEESNTHGFDNREGTEHVSGVYRWIDIIYKNQLINYGKRLMYEFMIPEPARFFSKEAPKNTGDTCGVETIEKPKHPSKLGAFSINNSSELTPYNYQQIASIYAAEVTAPPELNKATGISFIKSEASGDGGNFTNKAAEKEVDVPRGYKATNANVKISYKGTSGFKLSVSVGNQKQYTTGNSSGWFFPSIGDHTEKVPVSAYFNKTWVGLVNVNINFERTDDTLQQWKNETYKLIIDAYNVRLKEYNDAKLIKCINEKQENKDGKTKRFNPLYNRVIEKRELKRICIEMLTQPFNNPMGKDNYTKGACGIPKVLQNAAFEDHAAHVKFFEQAFDWEIMAYLFYPYYWAKNCDWQNLLQSTEASDPIFQAFMQSGMARAVIPVRPGFEDAVVYYIETGDIWNGGDLVIDQEDDLYISIADEMQNIEGKVEKEWESRVPTALTILQKDTVGLNETGLPCCDFVVENDLENPIYPSNAELGVVDGSTTNLL